MPNLTLNDAGGGATVGKRGHGTQPRIDQRARKACEHGRAKRAGTGAQSVCAGAGRPFSSQPRARSAACAMASASTSKCRRNAARVSLRPKPSVPSVTQRRPGGRNARICSGTART